MDVVTGSRGVGGGALPPPQDSALSASLAGSSPRVWGIQDDGRLALPFAPSMP